MRHFLGYDGSGKLTTVETMGYDGFPDDCDLSDSSCTHPVAMHIRAMRIGQGITNFIALDCECDGSSTCRCIKETLDCYYVVNGELAEKPTFEVYLEGELVDLSDKNPKIMSPSSKAELKLKVSNLNTSITIYTVDAMLIPASKQEVSLVNGESPPITITVPGQGLMGRLRFRCDSIAPAEITILGFAS